VSQNTKLKIFKTSLLTVLSYEVEARAMTPEEINTLRVFERKVVRKKAEES
jgi:hypothetical protein